MRAKTTTGLGYSAERNRLHGSVRIVAGIDEAGRGPWAGPVVAAAVILDPNRLPLGLDDSKKLNASRRQELFEEILASAETGIGIASVERIDRDNILAATLWAMRQALDRLGTAVDLALVDGNRAPQLPCTVETIIGGDAIIASIAAASIVAKVTRDRLMCELATLHPDYGFEQHKGYGTAMHRAALERHGPCAEHRHSFRPIKLLTASTIEVV